MSDNKNLPQKKTIRAWLCEKTNHLLVLPIKRWRRNNDAYLDELIVWADENKITDGVERDSFPRDKQAILALTELHLWSYDFTNLPESIGKLTNLTKLMLFSNELTRLPESIGKLTGLTYLNLMGNELFILPESIGELINLVELNLTCKLTKLPESIGKLTNLTLLELGGNQLAELPKSISELTNLIELDLSYNQLTELPESIGKLTNLTKLDLRENPIKTLPLALSHLRSITYFSQNNHQEVMTPKEKGDAFENYIIGKFDRKFFKLKDMRSDKGANGFYPESNKYPDLLLEYKPTSSLFAVECKWRMNWWEKNDGKENIDWAGGDKKIENYNQYSINNNVPVFVTIGVGGEPNNPSELFVVPLNALKYRYADKNYLSNFVKKEKARNFFFDSNQVTLK